MMNHRQKLFPHKSEHLHAEDSGEEQSDKTKKPPPLREGPNYLISDFFPTPRTIPEISVNLQKTFLGEGGGVRIPQVHLVRDMVLHLLCIPFCVFVSHLKGVYLAIRCWK